MSLLDRWVANTKRVLAKDKNTGSEYEFESIFPDGAPDGTAFSAENMNKIIDAVNGLDESKGQPNGIATLNSSGKLVQMPTAADVGAASISSGTRSMWTGLADGTYTSPKNVPWCKIGPYCFVEVVFTGTQTARVSKIYGLPYPAKVYCNVPVTYTPVSGSAALAGTIDAGKSEITVQWLADNTSNNVGKYYDIRANIIYRVED